MNMSENTTLAPVKLTAPQDEWIKAESFRTGNPKTTIVRNLIQEQIEKAK